jgi:hypothetical protein
MSPFPELLTCSDCGGHGSCSPDKTSCLCDAQWSNHTDWVAFPNCASSDIGMLVLWSVNFALCVYVALKCFNVILIRFETFFQQRRTHKDYTLWNNKGLIAVIGYFGISLPAHIAMCITRFIDPSSRIGFDIAPTLFFALGKLGFYMAVLFYQGPMLSVVVGREPKMRQIVVASSVGSAIIQTCVTIIGFFGFITLNPTIQTDVNKQIMVMRAYYFIQAAMLLCNGSMAFYVRFAVTRALTFSSTLTAGGAAVTNSGGGGASAPSSHVNKAMEIMGKVNDLQGTVIKQGLGQGIIYIVFGCVPFLFDKHEYLLPLSWIIMPILGKKLAFQISLDKTQNKTLAKRLGLVKSGTTSNPNESGSQFKSGGGGGGGKTDKDRTRNTSFNVEENTQIHTFVEGDADGKNN